MPGFLYDYGTFREELEIPITRKWNKEALVMLQHLTSPFILRRLKTDVLKELPEKMEEVVFARMEEDQQQEAQKNKESPDPVQHRQEVQNRCKDKVRRCKEDIPEDELKDAYEALRDMIPQMDYDAVEMILDQLKGYNLPKEDKDKMAELAKKLKVFDWEGMEAIINQ